MKLKDLSPGSIGYISVSDLVPVNEFVYSWEISKYAKCKPYREDLFTMPIRRVQSMTGKREYLIHNTRIVERDPWWINHIAFVVSCILVIVGFAIYYTFS